MAEICATWKEAKALEGTASVQVQEAVQRDNPLSPPLERALTSLMHYWKKWSTQEQ